MSNEHTKPEATDGDRDLAFVRKWIDTDESEGVQRTVLKELRELIATRLAPVEAEVANLKKLALDPDECREAAEAERDAPPQPETAHQPEGRHPRRVRRSLMANENKALTDSEKIVKLANLALFSVNNLKPIRGAGAIMTGTRVMSWQNHFKETLAECGLEVTAALSGERK